MNNPPTPPFLTREPPRRASMELKINVHEYRNMVMLYTLKKKISCLLLLYTNIVLKINRIWVIGDNMIHDA